MSPIIRINRFLASAGLGSRRKCEDLVNGGKVFINDNLVTDLSTKVNTGSDIVTIDGKCIEIYTRKVILVLNKPRGILSAAVDGRNRKTVIDLARDSGIKERLFPVGRLDMDTSGIILLTNDGDLSYRLTHPKFKIDKTYIVTIDGKITASALKAIRSGVRLEDFTTAPCRAIVLKEDERSTTLKIIIHEGKKRQIRRTFQKFGHRIISLHRAALGDLFFEDLAPGEIRVLTNEENRILREKSGLLKRSY
ncbi:MAG: rRNA pseudouridine synthase [Bacteroidales bacterium]|nr:rRNA pseudouridine synthase [Candidatus Latescibacterota bacterium]